jgi:succinate dehydrogenase flavin-adding protein (antitoxin of CptAB toxin-antitoxin module)
MLELGPLLRAFVDHAYAMASPEIREAFVGLLDMEDLDLLDLLTGRRAPDSPSQGEVARIIGLLLRR